jgi:hypothetical protein
MTTKLEACFQSASASAQADLQNLTNLLEKEEAEMADEKTRFDAEKAIRFYDELEANQVSPYTHYYLN